MPIIKKHKYLIREIEILMEEALYLNDGSYEMLLQELENLKPTIGGELWKMKPIEKWKDV